MIAVEGLRLQRGTTAQRLWCAVAFVVLVGPNIVAVVAPFEHWPWTCAPMFAASATGNALYRTHFILEKRDGTTAPLPTKDAAGLNDWHFRRSFLVKAWGSDDASTSFGHVDHDTPELRAARVGRYFDGMVRFAKKKRRPVFQGVTAVRVELEEVTPRQQTRLLGRYLVADRRFVLADRREPPQGLSTPGPGDQGAARDSDDDSASDDDSNDDNDVADHGKAPADRRDGSP